MKEIRIPTKDYRRQYEAIIDELLAEIRDTILADAPILGKSVAAFEQAFADAIGLPYAIGTNSGTDALALGMRGLGIGPGHEVITQANTFFATATAIEMVGATPVLVDCCADGPEIDSSHLEAAITPKTRAILVVHLHGLATPLARLETLTAEHDLLLLEDAAQAHGARLDDSRMVGSVGRFSAFSFHPSKNLGAFGDAGAVVTADETLAHLLRELRNLGKHGKHVAAHVAPNSKLDSLQATILAYRLPHLEQMNCRRRELAACYLCELDGIDGLELPRPRPGTTPVFHHFVVLSPHRDRLRDALAAKGIKTSLHYPTPLHLQPAFAHLGHRPGSFPQAERRAAEGLSLPLSHELHDEEILTVARAVRSFFEEDGR